MDGEKKHGVIIYFKFHNQLIFHYSEGHGGKEMGIYAPLEVLYG